MNNYSYIQKHTKSSTFNPSINPLFSWKKHLLLGIAIKQNYDKYSSINNVFDSNFLEDLLQIKEEIYNGLKGI